MCEEEAWGAASSCCIVKMEGESREGRGMGEALSDENEIE
jgi:hypothetical protein